MGCAASAKPPERPEQPDASHKETPVMSGHPEKAKSEQLAGASSVVFVLGGPGSGKGTQCEKILAKYQGVHHFSAGDLLRDAVKKGNTELEAIMKEGSLVPMDVTIGLLRDAMLASGGRNFLIDGFPRAMDQAEAFERQIQPCDMVLAFACPESVMRERLLSRGKTSGRADDNEETIVKRFNTFVQQSKPVIEHFKEMGKCSEISAVATPDEVFYEVCAAISARLPKWKVKAAATAHEVHSVPVVAPEAAKRSTLPKGSRIFFVLGGPGSGKGTQCEKILTEYADCGVHHFSAGDLLRDAVRKGNAELEGIMREGKLVPMDVTIGLLRDAMLGSGGRTFLIDGFPRAMDQARAFEASIQPCEAVLFFDCSELVMRERLLSRSKTSGRADDNEATIVKRFNTFVQQSKPVIEHFKGLGKCFEINAEQVPNAVFADVQTALEPMLRPATAAMAAAVLTENNTKKERALPANVQIVFVLGGPGSGKGTQCEKIVARYEGVRHFSAGDLLREAVKKGNKDLEAIMTEGKLVPMDITIGLLREAMLASGGSRFLIDGFPRAMDQAEAFEAGIQACEAVLYFECSEGIMRQRLLSRSKTSGRADDNEATIVKRFNTFVEQSKPVIEHYKSQGKCIEVSGEQLPDAVFAEVQTALDKLFYMPQPVAA